jgi:hypothetical protein
MISAIGKIHRLVVLQLENVVVPLETRTQAKMEIGGSAPSF